MTSTRLPAAPYLSAFSIRFSNTRISSSRSPGTINAAEGLVIEISTPRSFASVCSASTTCRTTDRRSTGLSGRKCALSSIRESESRSSISRAMRVACDSIILRKRARAAGSSRAEPFNVSMKPEKAASGVRNSWLALATKSARISSTRRKGDRSRNVRRKLPSPNGRAFPADGDRRNDRFPPSFGRNAFGELDALDRLPFTARAMASTSSGIRNPIDGDSPRRNPGATCARGRIERDDIAVVIENDRRIGQRVEKRRQQILRLSRTSSAAGQPFAKCRVSRERNRRGQKKDQPRRRAESAQSVAPHCDRGSQR